MVGQKNQGKVEPVKLETTPNAKNDSKNQGHGKNDERKGEQQPQTPWQKKGQYRGNRHDKRGKPHQQQHQQKQPQVQAADAEGAEPIVPQAERKFTGRCRLFVGNLTNDCVENEFKKLFEPFGEYSEVFVNPNRGFGFIKMDTRQNAESAKAALDGQQRKGRVLRVRFATHGAALRVKYLPVHVSNELLEEAFSQFGDVERAIVIVDDRGRPTGEGIVEFARKPGAQQALNRINEGVFMMGTTPKPIIVEPLDQKDEEDGLPEKFILKNQQILKEREEPPRFAPRGSFEFDFAQKWKELYKMEEQQKDQVKRNMEEAAIKLDMDMETAQHEHQTMLLRQDLLRRQEELRRLEEQHQQDLQRKLDMRHQEEAMRRDALQRRMDNRRTPDHRMDSRRQDDDMRRQEEERRHQELVMRQQQEEEMMRRQMDRGRDGEFPPERAMRDMGRERGNAPPMQPPPAPPVGLGLERNARQSGMGGGMGNQGGPNQGGPNQGGMGNQGMGGGQGNNGMGGMNQQPLRQSRFDQPPPNAGSGFGNMGGGGNMGPGGQGNMNNSGAPGGNMGNAGNQNMGRGPGGPGGHMGNERMMDRRDHRDEFFESKRQRRF